MSSLQDQPGIKNMILEYLKLGTMPKPYLDHVMAIFGLARLARALTFSRLSPLGRKDMFLEYSNFGTMTRPYLDHVMANARAMFGLS